MDFGESAPALRKQADHLDEHCREFIPRSPFFVLATAASDDTCDTSPRGGLPGFVRVLDARRLLVPEYPGNRRADARRCGSRRPGRTRCRGRP